MALLTTYQQVSDFADCITDSKIKPTSYFESESV